MRLCYWQVKLVVLFLVLVMAGDSALAVGTPKGGTLNIAWPQRPSNFDTYNIIQGIQMRLFWEYTFRCLFKIEKGQVSPDLAAGWRASEDGKTITVNLRDDIVWQDGVKFTAQDVKFTFEFMFDPQAKGTERNRGNFEAVVGAAEKLKGTAKEISGITVKDPYTVVFRLNQAVGLFISYLAQLPMLPEHVVKNRLFLSKETRILK